MSIIAISRGMAKLEYSAMRLPFTFFEEQVLARYWEDEAPFRSLFEHFLGSLDVVAGRLLADDDIYRRGQTLMRQAELLPEVNWLDSMVYVHQPQAEQTPHAERTEAGREGTDGAAAAEEPAAAAEEPTATAWAAATTEEPTAATEEPAAAAEEAAATATEEPIATPGEPATTVTEEPTATPEEPIATATEEPTATLEEPATADEQLASAVTAQTPVATPEEPAAATAEEPAATGVEPAATADEPATAGEAPEQADEPEPAGDPGKMIKFRTPDGRASVTFMLDPRVGAEAAAVCGEWNGWSAEANVMNRTAEGGFSLTVDLEAGRAYRFRYLLDGQRWANDRDADAYLPNGFGEDDSVVDLTALARVIPPTANKDVSTEHERP